jgi:DNA-binding FadR family transcriptional regulator
VAQWRALVPVVALELGSALAGLLVQAVIHQKIEAKPLERVTERSKVAEAIVDHLKANGGAVLGSHRVLGVKLGANRNTINRALHSLAASGVVALSSSKAGSVVRLAA